MTYNTILLNKRDGVTTITLNRPDSYNAFNNEMGVEFLSALQEVSNDEECRVVILTGQGKSFSSGQDLKEVDGSNIKLSEILHHRYNPIIKAMREMPKPIICKLNGIAAGAGCSLVLACDYIVANDKSALAEVFINIGLVLDSGSTYFLPRLIGTNRAFELATTGRKVSAQEAVEWGMINKCVPIESLDDEVAKMARYYANAPTKAIALMKQMINDSTNQTLDQVLEAEALGQEIAGFSKDYEEGVNAFKEKRKPNFVGS